MNIDYGCKYFSTFLPVFTLTMFIPQFRNLGAIEGLSVNDYETLRIIIERLPVILLDPPGIFTHDRIIIAELRNWLDCVRNIYSNYRESEDIWRLSCVIANLILLYSPQRNEANIRSHSIDRLHNETSQSSQSSRSGLIVYRSSIHRNPVVRNI